MKDDHSRTDAESSGFVEASRVGDPRDPNNIPTADPEATVKFCRNLARLLLENPGIAAAITGQTHADRPLDSDHTSVQGDSNLVSVVIPVYNEQQNIPVLYTRLRRVLQNVSMNYEITFVDDGSRDRSQEILLGLASQDPRIVVLELARNFGHQTAITAGIDQARGIAVTIMDADLQDPPELFHKFIAQ